MHGQKFGVIRYIQRNVFEKQLIITIIMIMYKDLFRTEQYTPSVFVMITSRLIFYTSVFAVYSEDHAKHGKTFL
jgi:high-affinity K+ transport system ATPase subunit B